MKTTTELFFSLLPALKSPHAFFLFSSFAAGILVNLHQPASLLPNNNNNPFNNNKQLVCGAINVDVVQQVVAAKWAVDIINNRSLDHEPKIGKMSELIATNFEAANDFKERDKVVYPTKQANPNCVFSKWATFP